MFVLTGHVKRMIHGFLIPSWICIKTPATKFGTSIRKNKLLILLIHNHQFDPSYQKVFDFLKAMLAPIY